MLQECVEVFAEILKEKTEQFLLDNYVPKNGTYILLNIENDFKVEKRLEIKTDKKTGSVDGCTDSDYSFIVYLDYYSKLIEMNKPVDTTKIIHSNNFYSFFIKKEKLDTELPEKDKLSDKNIEAYYDALKSPKKKHEKSKKAKDLYEKIEAELGKPDLNDLEMIYNWIKINFQNLADDNNIDIKEKDYLKVFFIKNSREDTKRLFYTEGRRYIYPNIYNKNDFNEVCKEGIKGLPSNNMGMNGKKPYLENKTRKIGMPYMLFLENALMQMKFFDYLSGCAARGENNIYIDLDRKDIYHFENGKSISEIENGIYLRIKQGKEPEIHNMSRITGYKSVLSVPFHMNEVVPVPDKYKSESENGSKTKLTEIEELVDEVFFSKSLKHNYFTEPGEISINNGTLKRVLLMYREQLWDWFYKGNTKYIYMLTKKMAMSLIKEAIRNDYYMKAKHQINLLISILDYFNKDRRMELRMSDVRSALKEHIDSKDEWMFGSDDEYYYAVGQLLNTFLGLTKSQKKNLSMINPVLNSKNDKRIKEQLMVMFKKYNYAIETNNVRIKALLGHIMRYEPSASGEFMLIAGFVDSNLVYRKKEDSNAIVDIENKTV